MMHDAQDYRDPFIFDPDRFLSRNEQGKTNFLPGTTAIGPGHIYMRPGYSLLIECDLNVYEPDQDLIVFDI